MIQARRHASYARDPLVNPPVLPAPPPEGGGPVTEKPSHLHDGLPPMSAPQILNTRSDPMHQPGIEPGSHQWEGGLLTAELGGLQLLKSKIEIIEKMMQKYSVTTRGNVCTPSRTNC